MRQAILVAVVVLLVSSCPLLAQTYTSEYNQLIALTNSRQYDAAIQHGLRAMALDPKSWTAPFGVSRAQGMNNQYSAAEASITKAIANYEAGAAPRKIDYHVVVYVQRAGFRKWLGELEAGIKDIEKALSISRGNPIALNMKGEFEILAGKPDVAVKSMAEALRNHTSAHQRSLRRLNVVYNHADALRVAGKTSDALAAFGRVKSESDPEAYLGTVGQARIYALSKGVVDMKKARSLLDSVKGHGGALRQREANTDAIIAYHEGRYDYALALFRMSQHAVDDTEGLWFHGLTRLKVGDRDAGIKFLTMACSLWKSYRDALDSNPTSKAVAAVVRSRLGDLKGKTSVQERIQTRREQDLAGMDLSQIIGFVRTFKFSQALKELDTYKKGVSAASVKKGVEARVKRVKAYQKLHDKLIKAIKSGPLKGKKLKLDSLGDTSLKLVGADRKGFKIEIGGKGATRATWANVSFKDRWTMLSQLRLSAKEWFSLAELSVDVDDAKQAERAMTKAWRDRPLRSKINDLLASVREEGMPEGGFALYKGKFIPSADQKKLSRGLVYFRGEWVTKKDRYHLEKNHVKIDGKWVPLTEAQLRARGLTLHNGKWVTQKELSKLKGEWDSAWTHETANYRIKTNVSDKFAKRLGVALEDAYPVYKKFFGKDPVGGSKQLVLAMKTYEDYRSYCQKNGMMNMVNATGFAMSHKRTVIGYDKLKNKDSLIGTMLHEGGHLYYGLAYQFPPPSWLAEGMATFFEGFKVDRAGHVTFDHKAKNRLHRLQMAINGKQTIPMEKFLKGNALALINSNANQASVFYAQAWGLFYFFNKTINQSYRAAFQKYFDGAKRGAKPNLKKLLGGSFSQLEKDFIKFIKSM